MVIEAQDACDPAALPAVCNETVTLPDGSQAPRPFVEDGVPPTATAVPAAKLSRGANLFQCMIHPWMHATVTVE